MTYKTFYAIAISLIGVSILFLIWFVAVNYLYSESSDAYLNATKYTWRHMPDSSVYWGFKADSLRDEAENLHYFFTK